MRAMARSAQDLRRLFLNMAATKKSASTAIPPKEREHLEECVAAIKSFIELWVQFYWSFRRIFSGDTVTVQKELQFLQLKSEVARRHQYLYDLLGNLYIDGAYITDLLRKVVNLEKISHTQKENYYKVEKGWHTVLINLNDTLITIQFRMDQEDKS
ncbi:MAG: hypothetical protein UZ16_OP3001001067 [Candidatus Hinthialibacteria bacterium OLB16]|nr:MAG: hypothetical protein UZ16_OP3001001067 [Candidatus Hinthialibacteria bacterium OLB16]MBK7495482.1 hypothetical protein [Candidatus Omnitrophota bacterium]